MGRVAIDRLLAASLAASGALLPSQAATAAVEKAQPRQFAEANAGVSAPLGDSADLMMQYIQEDGPESGHVRIVLSPETRPLTMIEARAAAQQAFLQALTEPGLGDDLKRITVVVRLMPASHPDPAGTEQVVVFLHKGGRDWSVVAGE
jgi:hypothetical protein